ncbi:MAG: hypothetical protein ACKER6_01205, partial [Candidatus Hodgkinia cicadicola]
MNVNFLKLDFGRSYLTQLPSKLIVKLKQCRNKLNQVSYFALVGLLLKGSLLCLTVNWLTRRVCASCAVKILSCWAFASIVSLTAVV